MSNGAGPVDDARAVLVARLRARRGELVDAIFARARGDALGAAGAQDAEYVAGLRAVVSAALEYVLMEIEHGEELQEPIPSALPALLSNPSARRARECLLFLADHPGASNRELATGIGVTHQPQISRLLSQLAAESLVSRPSQGRGTRNAWRLTSRGEEVLRLLPRQPN